MSLNIFAYLRYKPDKVLDELLNKYLDSGIKYVRFSSVFIRVIFNNDKVGIFWNLNKYKEWLSRGSIGNYSYRKVRPKRKTVKRFENAVEEYFISHN